jgi:hypothetical protein
MKKLFITLAFLLMFCQNSAAQTPCFDVDLNPPVTYDGTCDIDPNLECAQGCGECRYISIRNRMDCAVTKVVFHAGPDTCFAVCGSISKPHHPIWVRSREDCGSDFMDLTPYNDPADVMEPYLTPPPVRGDTMYLKICSASFPINLRIELWCDGALVHSCMDVITIN